MVTAYLNTQSYYNVINNKPKLNILHIVQYDFETFKGGIQRYVKDLSELQKAKGHNVTVYSCSKTEGKEVVNGVIIKRFNYFEIFRTPISPSMIISLLKEKERFDIIHIHAQFPIIAELTTLIAKLKNIPIVITYHNEAELASNSFFTKIIYNIWKNTLLKMMLDLSNLIITTNEEFTITSRILNKKRYGKKIRIIPCGIVHINNHIKISNKYHQRDYLLYVGRIKKEKGLHIILEALSILKKRNIDLDLIIVGEATRDDELKYKNELEDLINRFDLTKNIRFVGSVSDYELNDYYANALALILPSINRLEGFGIVQLEAMRYGIPIIVSDIPGPRNVAKGLSVLFNPNNAVSLSNAILKVMDPIVRENIRKLSLEIIKEYDWNRLIDKIERLYMDIINNRGRTNI